MRIVEPGYEVVTLEPEKDILCIERAARLCYKSEARIQDGSAEKLIKFLIDHGHEAMLEHSRMSVIFTVDRGVSHELVRHRLFSFAQESTRYCNYANDQFGHEIAIVEPSIFQELDPDTRALIRKVCDEATVHEREKFEYAGDEQARKYFEWYISCLESEHRYFQLLSAGATPQEARAVLPNSLKTEIMVTGNYREWRHVFQLRTANDAHPDIRGVMRALLEYVKTQVPAVFDDIP